MVSHPAHNHKSLLTITTSALLNEAFTQLKSAAGEYRFASSNVGEREIQEQLYACSLRMESMCQDLTRSGARSTSRKQANPPLTLTEDICRAPLQCLSAIENIQTGIVDRYARLTERLDMDTDTFDMLQLQHEEMFECLLAIKDTTRAYAARHLRDEE